AFDPSTPRPSTVRPRAGSWVGNRPTASRRDGYSRPATYMHSTILLRTERRFTTARHESAAKRSLDAILRAEADFANLDYDAHQHDLAINPGMFRRYHSPADLWDWRQRSALLLGDIRGTDLLDFGCGMGEES